MCKDLQRLISENQHGYVKGRSTVSNLLEYTSFILKFMEDGLQVYSIYTDFSKVFDKVRHQLLLIKQALAHTSPAEHSELESEAAFRKRSKSRRRRVAIWVHYASSGLSMTLPRFSNTYEFFFMLMT
jgi:hypothetical protein